MADRQPLKFAPTGSLAWITNERSTILQLGDQDFEDFAFSARTDLEWLNEHMADIFERTQVDVAELLKTPGRLRGKTPRTTRKRLGPVEPFAEVFGANKPAAVLPASDNRFYNALSQPPSNSTRASPARAKSPAAKSPDRLLRRQPDIPQKLSDPMNDSGIGFSQPEGLPVRVSDSGIWSASSESASQQPAFSSQQKSPPPLQEFAKTSLPIASEGESDGRRTTQQSFRTAQEEESSDRPQSPVQPAPKSPKKALEKQKPVGQPLAGSAPHTAASISDAEPRRSGRLRSARTSTEPESSQNEDEVAPPSSPPVARQDLWQPATEAPVPLAKSESHPRQPAEAPLATISSRNEEKQRREDPPTPVSERSVSGSPEEPTIRKSILNFAPLPAREPLTNKKKSLGVRATRESHIEQLRANGTNRASWLNRKGNGKSLGATSRQVEHITNRVEDEQGEAPKKPRSSKRKGEQQDEGRSRKRSKSINPGDAADQENDSHGETERAVALHNKIFTQNLHVKIQQLGKHNATREARTTSVLPTDPPYPDLSQHEPERSAPALTSSKSFQEDELPGSARRRVERTLAASELPKSQLSRSHTDPDLKFRESPLSMPASPKKRPSNTQYPPFPIPARSTSVVSLDTSNSNAVLQSPPTQPAPPSPQKISPGAKHQDASSKGSSSSAGTPSEGAISAVRSHTASVFKKAKEMLLKSSVASASAKVESLSPVPTGWQGAHGPKQAIPKEAATGRVQPATKTSEEQLYPDLGSFRTGQVPTEEVPTRNPTANQPRQTRNSRSKESAREEAEKATPAPVEEAAVPAPLLKSPKKLKNAAREEELRQVREQRRKHQEEMLRKEKEELRRRQQEEIQREKEEQQRKTKEMTLDDSSEQEDEQDEETTDNSVTRGRVGSSAEPERPPSRLQKAPPSRFQKTTESKRPVRPAKETAKPKPAPVSIRIGTASQREMQDQRNKLVAPSGSTLISALKSSFEPSQSQTGSFSQSSFQSSAPASNLRGPSNAGTSGRLKSLTAAANQLKKEQEEKERKLAAKREIERRRRENSRRQNQEEEQRKLKQKPFQAIPQSAKTLSRMQSVANLRQKSEEPENKKLEYQSKTLGLQKGAPSKRALQQDPSSDDQQYPRLAPPRPGGPAYQQEGAKKRRTGEFEEQLHRPTKEMAPPIRPSVAKKELTTKATLPHAHAPTPASQLAPPSSVPSISRPPTKPAGGAVPSVEGVKFSKDKIKFAISDPPGPSADPNHTPATFKTPGTTRSMKLAKTPAGVKESPIYQNGELIDLPEIPTDSEDDGDDDDDDNAPKDNFHVPNWAESPELRQILLHQQETNPDAVFGPVARLDMEAIFHPRTDRQAARFRSRTSSANWSGADRLTPAEIEADQEARRRMIEQGGWVYSSSAL